MIGLPDMAVCAYSEANLEALRGLFRAFPEVREGRMFGYPAFFVGRRMFACVYDVGVGVKLPADDVQALLQSRGNIPFQPHGKARMREWVQLNRPRSSDYMEEMNVFERSTRFVQEKQIGGIG